MTPRARFFGLDIAVAAATRANAGSLDQSASCPDGVHIVVQWNWYETPGSPVGYPQWVGYDVLRRTAGTCDAYALLNSQPFPRTVGQSHSGSYSEVAPALHTTFEYRVVPVDASHQPVIMSSVDCDPPCIHYASASCPDLSGPTTIGKVFAFHGGFGCGGVEGCGLAVTQYDPADCGPTPTQTSSWGRLKTLYR